MFLEFFTYRWREHCGPNYDNTLGYRPETEFLKWKKNCPINRLKQYALKNKLIKKEEFTKIHKQIDQKINQIVYKVKKASAPSRPVSITDVYAP